MISLGSGEIRLNRLRTRGMDRLIPREREFINLSRSQRASSAWVARSLNGMQSRLAHIYLYISVTSGWYPVDVTCGYAAFVFLGNIRVQSEPVYWGIIRHEGVVFYLIFCESNFCYR